MAESLIKRIPSTFEDVALQTRPSTPAVDAQPDIEAPAEPLSIATLPHRRRTGLIVTLVALTVLLIAMAIIGYFFFPRKVDVVLGDDTRIYDVGLQTSQLTLNVERTVEIFNPNVYAIFVDSVNATLSRMGVIIGIANATSLTFPPKVNTTMPFAINVMIPYAIMPDILRTCGILPGTTAQPLNATYDVSIDIKALRFAIKRPQQTGVIALPCPPPVQSALLDVADKLPQPIQDLLHGIF